jgi:hypothetical protein
MNTKFCLLNSFPQGALAAYAASSLSAYGIVTKTPRTTQDAAQNREFIIDK